MAKHTMNKREVKTTKLRKSKYFVTLENEKGNVPKSYLYPEKNTYAFTLDAERRRETIVAYYGGLGGFMYQDLKIVEHGKLPFSRAFRESCRLNMVIGKTLLSDLGFFLGVIFPAMALVIFGLFTLLGFDVDVPLLEIAISSFLIGGILWSVGVPAKALFQVRKLMTGNAERASKTVNV